jgi:hypothetical protein
MTPDYSTLADRHQNTRLDRVVGWPLHAFALIAGLACVAGSFNITAAFVGLLLSFVAVVAWLGLFIRAIVIWRADFFRRKASIRWTLGPLIFIATIILSCSGVPFYAAFLVSRPAMDRLVTEITAAAPGTPLPTHRWVGLFDLSDIQITPAGIHFRAGYGGLFDWCGFAYCTAPPPSSDPPFYYAPLSGKWYTCMRD